LILRFTIKPYDVLFFGSGKPFNLGDVAVSIFPPFPHTLAGAISSRITINNPLKRIFGPFLFNQKESKLYFPKPADIYGERKSKSSNKIFTLTPLKEDLHIFNHENTNMPEGINELTVFYGKEDVESFVGYISQKGLSDWLKGKSIDPSEIKKNEDIFGYENRLGIFQNTDTHTVTQENGLYRIEMVRLKDEWKLLCWVEFSDVVDKDKVMTAFKSNPKVLKLGGEMKTAQYDLEEDESILNLFEKIEPKKGEIVKLLYLTPGVYNDFIPDIKGLRVKSIITTGHINMGLHSPQKLGKYRVMKKSLPPGTVIYCEVEDASQAMQVWLNPSHGDNDFIGSNLIVYGRP